MPENSENTGRLTALLLIERQAANAWYWRFEWIILTWIALALIAMVEILLGPHVGLTTLIAVLAALVAGFDLARRERTGLRHLAKLYFRLIERPPFWEPPFHDWPFWDRRWR